LTFAVLMLDIETGMDVERIIDDIKQLQGMFEARSKGTFSALRIISVNDVSMITRSMWQRQNTSVRILSLLHHTALLPRPQNNFLVAGHRSRAGPPPSAHVPGTGQQGDRMTFRRLAIPAEMADQRKAESTVVINCCNQAITLVDGS
jgi:hypothetical protein